MSILLFISLLYAKTNSFVVAYPGKIPHGVLLMKSEENRKLEFHVSKFRNGEIQSMVQVSHATFSDLRKHYDSLFNHLKKSELRLCPPDQKIHFKDYEDKKVLNEGSYCIHPQDKKQNRLWKTVSDSLAALLK